MTVPIAWSTPSIAATSSTTDSSSGRAKSSPKSPSTASFARTVTSMLSFADANRSSNARSTESVSSSVPLTIATPKNTASAVESARNLRALKLRTASESTGGQALSRDVGITRHQAVCISSSTCSELSTTVSLATLPSTSRTTRSA